MNDVPPEVLEAYGLAGADCRPLAGLINRSFLVQARARRAVVQRVHPVFGAEVQLDIEAVTTHLHEKGLCTPRLLRTRDGRLWVERADGIWRAQSFVEGATYHHLDSASQAHAAGAAVARFHRALQDFSYSFRFTRAGVHDTAAHIAALRTALERADAADGQEQEQEQGQARALAERVLQAVEPLDLEAFAHLPRRICHGDLKISNLLFAAAGEPRVQCLIDLDTVGYQRIAYELGDALRSWCNPQPEDSERPRFSSELFEAALRGYAQEAQGLLQPAEIDSIVPGLRLVCLELATRFSQDAFADSYFGWDPARYPSRRAHNLARARSQLALGLSIGAQLDELAARARAAFTG